MTRNAVSRKATPAMPRTAAGRQGYAALLEAIESANAQMVGRAAIAVNRALVLRNWLIGAYIVKFEQGGADRAKYGARLLERLASDLAKRGLKALNLTLLKLCRLYYQAYPQIGPTLSDQLGHALPAAAVRQTASVGSALQIGPTVSDESAPGTRIPAKTPTESPSALSTELVLCFSWSQLVELLAIGDPWKRAFFENECLKGNWSVRQLRRQIESLLYERTGLSANKRAVIARARRQAGEAPAETFADMIRDPYILEFAGLAERPAYSESDLETALLDHLQHFLLELGAGFCFEARQFRFTWNNKHHRVDLVFYHRSLRCHVLLELKVRAFDHAHAGQMNFYLNWFKVHMKAEGDNPPVGIILCSDKDRTEVEFATGGMDNKLFVSRYLTALPSAKHLKALIDADRAFFEQQHPKAWTSRG
jgi:predicted nuclease of restriction endonuclease-like (RecB) superfamily